MEKVMEKIDYRQLLIDELEDLSDQDVERIYKVVSVLRNEFLAMDDIDDEARYRTESWIEAEREATEAYKRGDVKRFKSVQEMADYIEANIEAEEKAE